MNNIVGFGVSLRLSPIKNEQIHAFFKNYDGDTAIIHLYLNNTKFIHNSDLHALVQNYNPQSIT